MPSFQVRVPFASMFFFVDNLSGEEEEGEEKKENQRLVFVLRQTLGVREERKVKLGLILFTSLKIPTMLKLRNTLPLEYFFFSTSGLDRK